MQIRSSVALQSSFSTADCSGVFLTGDLRSNLCHDQSARLSWCHPDAPSWNTHQPLCLLHLRFRALFFSPSRTCTNTYRDARPLVPIDERRCTLWNQRGDQMHAQVRSTRTRAHPHSQTSPCLGEMQQWEINNKFPIPFHWVLPVLAHS